jgi:hypothetical protein
LPATPAQADIDRQLSSYEAWVSVDDLPGDDGLLASMPTSRTAVEVRR